MKHLFTSKRKGYLLFSFIVFFSTHVHSQCTLNASISGSTSVCTGNTTLTANVTGASSCSGSEGVGLIYNMDYCQFGTPYPATVTPSNCGISLTSVENFTAGYSAANSCTQNGAEGSSQSMCAPQSNSTYFNDPTSLPNQYGFFFTVGASATSSGVLSKVSFYVRGSIALSGPVSSTLFGIRITDPSGSIVYYEQSGLSVPRYAWQQYTIDLSTDPDFVLSGTVKQYRVFIQGYAPEPGFVPVDATGQELRTILEIDQVRVYYGCGSASSTPTYSWTGPNGFTSSQQSITATTAGTYYVTVTDCKGCSVTKSVVVTGCANCSISSVSATPSACNSSTNTYSATGWIDFSNPPSSGTLTVSDGTASQTFYAPFTSPLSYTMTGITANGSSHTVTASFSAASCSNTTTYTSPASCTVSNCTVSLTAIPGTCDPSTNTYSISGRATIFNARGGSIITFTDGVTSQSYTVPSSQVSTTWVDYTLIGFTSNGNSHTVTAVVSNGASCSGTTTYNAPMSCLCTNPTPSVNNSSICAGNSATLTVSNCAGSVTWNDGLSGATRTVSPTFTTSYTATCSVGTCTGTASGTVTVIANPTPSVNNSSICSGNSATLTVSNCLGTVTWNDGTAGATKTVSPTATTTYTATCTVGTCTGTASGTVTVTTASNPTPSVNSPSICAGSSATLTVSNCAGTVTWNDGTTGLTKTVSPTVTTSYTVTCTVTNGNCTGTGTANGTVTVTPKPTPSVNNPSICAGSSATLSVSNCAGTVTWNDGTTGATKTVSPTATTTYTATCTVGTCAGTTSSTVTVTTASNSTPSINSPSICSGSSATLTVSNCAGSVTWNDGTTSLTKTVSPTATTSYTATCTVTNGNCSGTGTATGTVTVTPKPTPSVNSPTICASSSATLTVSNCIGNVTWNDGTTGATKTVSPTATTTYTATCTVGTCAGTTSSTVTVTTASNPTPSVNSPTICSGSSATLTVSNCTGSVTWNDGTTGLAKTVTPTATTTYTATCTVTTGNCTGTGTATGTVTVTPKPTPSVNSPTICASSSATLTVSNCAGTVTWNDGTTGATKTVSPTATATYIATCTVGSCASTASGTVTVTTASNPTPSVNSPSICSGSSATLTVSNCTGSVTWNDGTTGLTKTVTPTATTSYTATCTVTIGNCSGTGMATATVTVTPKPTPSINSPTICSGSSATLTVSNCTGSVTWNDGTTGLTKTVTPTATSTYTASCSVGTCTGTASGTVTVTTASNPTPSINNPSICSGSSATLTVSNCAGSVTWNDGTTGLTKTVSPTTTTSYTTTCTVTTGNCSGTGTATATVTVTPKPTPSVNSPTICTGNSATLSVSNCAGTVTWNDGTTGATKTVSPTVTTTYTATCTVGSCTDKATGTVTVTTASNPTPSVNSPSICSGSSATLTVSNCTGSVTWNDGTTGLTKTVTPTATTSYTATCTVTTGNCSGTGTATGTVTVTPKPTPSVNSPTNCAGSSATLTVSNCAGSVTWNDGTTGATKTVNPTATTTYTATCTVGTCTGSASGTVTVTPKPTITINTSNISCSTDLTTYSLTFTATAGAIVSTDKGTLSGTAVSGIPSGQTVTLTASLNGCTATASATKSCNCPNINPPTGTNKEICEGDAIPTLSVTVDAGLQADWYSATSGGTKLASGLNYTPTTAQYPLGGDFYVEAVNTTSNCKSASRTKVSLIINPIPTITTQTTCAANGLSYSVTVTTNATSITTDKGSVSGMTVTGIPVGQTVTITATSDKGCKVTTTATQNCTTSVFDLALKKTLATGQNANVVAGGTVKFTISIINQGNVGATNVQVSDYIPTGLTLNDANWTATGSIATLNSMIASLPAGQTTTRDITFTVGNSVTGTITNFAEISSASNAQNLIDIDSTPDANATNDGTPKNDVVNENGKTGGDEDDHDPESIIVTPNCVLPTFKVTTPSVCNTSTWSVGITVSQVGTIKVNKGTVSGTGANFTVSNIPSGTTLIITDSLSATCKKDTTIAPPAGCNCITVPPVLAIGQNTTVCKGEPYPTLNAVIVGYGTVDWYKKLTGGTAVATGTVSYKPAGVVAANDTFYLQARNLAVGTCPDPTTRTRVIVVAQTCTDTVDLALKKMVDKKLVKLGDVVTFTIKVWNESNKNATGVEVTDSIATTMQFVNGSFVASRAATPPTIVGNVIKWNIGSIAANGDTVTLTYRVIATQEGVHFNTAEICKTNEKDVDSTPCNHKDDEDDIGRQCFTVPFKLCPNEKVEAVVPSTYTNVLWFKNGSSTAIASGNVVLLADVGIYTFTASNQTCPAEGCCPIIIETGTNCCPAELCIPFTIKKKKK